LIATTPLPDQYPRRGTVIVDVVDPRTKELLWRGVGKAPVSDDESKFERDLATTVTAILAKFPPAVGS
jgi:hypothetical protein